MDMEQITRGLESHQGKWMTIYNNKITIADSEEKLRGQVPATCEVRQIPAMIYGKTTWSNAVSTIVQTLADKQPPADILREPPQPETVEVAEIQHDERRPGFFGRLFGRGKRREERRQESRDYSSDDGSEVVYGG